MAFFQGLSRINFLFFIKYFKILSVNHARLVSLSQKKRREIAPPALKLHFVILRGGCRSRRCRTFLPTSKPSPLPLTPLPPPSLLLFSLQLLVDCCFFHRCHCRCHHCPCCCRCCLCHCTIAIAVATAIIVAATDVKTVAAATNASAAAIVAAFFTAALS